MQTGGLWSVWVTRWGVLLLGRRTIGSSAGLAALGACPTSFQSLMPEDGDGSTGTCGILCCTLILSCHQQGPGQPACSLLPRARGLRRPMSKCAHWVTCRVWRSSREEASVSAFLAEGAAEVAGWRLVAQAKCECAAFRNRPRSLAAKRKGGKWLLCWKGKEWIESCWQTLSALDLEVFPYSVY